jgi:hypothetical protein
MRRDERDRSLELEMFPTDPPPLPTAGSLEKFEEESGTPDGFDLNFYNEHPTVEKTTQVELLQVILVPVGVFGEKEVYGLCDEVGGESDCNRADGKIYRKADDDEDWSGFSDDVIHVYVPESELHKFDRIHL